MVLDTSRRTDDHLGTAMKLSELEGIVLTTVDRQHVESFQMTRIGLKRLGHLDGQFAGRSQHEHLWLFQRQIDSRQERQCKGTGLAGPGLGQAHDVLALEQRRYTSRLYRQGAFITQFSDGLDKRGGQVQLTEPPGGIGHGETPNRWDKQIS